MFRLVYLMLGLAWTIGAIPMFQTPKTEQVVSAQAGRMPGVKSLEILRGSDPEMVENCVEDSLDCQPYIKQALQDLESHKGVVVLNDGMLVYFCSESPQASKLSACQGRDAVSMKAHLSQYKDAEFRNAELLACINHEPRCPSAMRTHLENLLAEPETLLPIQHILVYMCKYSSYKAELAICTRDAGKLMWKRTTRGHRHTSKPPALEIPLS